jgi:ribosomal protein S27E
MSGIFPSCPECDRSVPFSRSAFGRGRPFACRRCGTTLIVPKAGGFAAVVIFTLLSLTGKRILEKPYGWLVIVALIGVGAFLEYLLLTVRKVVQQPAGEEHAGDEKKAA